MIGLVNEGPTIEIGALSWIIELPRDLGLRHDTAATVATATTPVPGWEGRLDRIPDWPGHRAEAVPWRRLRFRRAQVQIGAPGEATERTYGEQQRTWRGRVRSWRGVKEWKTVCQLTQWYLGNSIPKLPSGSELDEASPLRTDLAQMLEELDLWLLTYGAVAGEVDIGSIALHDLPATVPWSLHTRHSPDSNGVLRSGTVPIHGRLPDLEPAKGNDSAAQMASYVAAQGPRAYPLLTAVLMLFQAQSHALAGRGRHAVIDMGTAVEGVVLGVIRSAMAIRGHSKAEQEEVHERRWKDLFNRDLLEVLGVPIGQAGAHHSKWWQCHYRARIDAVHAGERISQDVAMEAVFDSWELIGWIGDRLLEQPDLAPLGKVLEIKELQGDVGRESWQ